MNSIRAQVSSIIGQAIPPNRWDEVFIELNKTGRFDSPVVLGILLAILKRLEKLEQNGQPT
jgi:hypothetical protein